MTPSDLEVTDVDAADAVLAVIGEVLGTEVDPLHEFIANGGDSVRAMQVTARVRRRLGLRVAPDSLLAAQSIERAVASSLRATPTETDEAAVEPDEISASRGQQQLWFVGTLDEGTGLYNLASTIDFRADRPRLGDLVSAIEATLAAHEALRTVFREGRGSLERVVLPPDAVEISVLDLRRDSDAERSFLAIASEAASRRFSLRDGPVARAKLVLRPGDLLSLVLVAHHTTLDAWSLGLLCDEMVGRYEEAADGSSSERSTPRSYGFFVAAEAAKRVAHRRADVRWWLDYLAGAPTSVNLARGSDRPSRHSFAGARLSFEPGDAEMIRTIARQIAATQFTLLVTAFGLCLSRLTGLRDFLIGIPIAGRDRVDLQEVVGFCAKLLPIRIAFDDDDEPFRVCARRLQRSVSMVLEHTAVDLADLVRATALSGDSSRNPLVQIVFAKHDDLVTRGAAAGEICLDVHDLDTGSSPVDLTLFIEDLRTPPRACIEYATAVVSEAEARRLADTYAATLGSALDDPQRTVAELLRLRP